MIMYLIIRFNIYAIQNSSDMLKWHIRFSFDLFMKARKTAMVLFTS